MTPIRRLQRALERDTLARERDLELAVDALAAAQLRALTQGWAPLDAAQREIARLVSAIKASGDLAGRLEVWWPRARAAEPDAFQQRWDAPGLEEPDFLGEVPRVAFDAAVRDLESRDTYGAEFLRRMDLSVRSVYGPVRQGDLTIYPRGFAAAKAITADAAARVQEKLVEGLRQGLTTEEVAASLSAGWGWPASYARTVTRTTYNTATTAGRFAEAQEVHDAGIATGFVVECVLDSDLRQGRPQDNGENHKAMDGFRARVDDPVWRTHSPPYSWNCRCLARVIVGDEVPKGFRKPPEAARFAPGFGTRGDLATYG